MEDSRLPRGIDGCRCQRCTFDRIFNRDRGRDLEVTPGLVVMDRADLADLAAMVPTVTRSRLAFARARAAGHPVVA